MARKIKLFLIMMLTVVLSMAVIACGQGLTDSTPEQSTPEISIPDDSTPEESSPQDSSAPEQLDAELIESIPQAGIITECEAGEKTAKAHWFMVYGEQALEVTVYVEDEVVYDNGGVYQNDGIMLYVSKVQRVKGYAGAISIIADAKGNVSAKTLATGDALQDSAITASAYKFTFDGEVVAGYVVELSIPYGETEATLESKDVAVALGLTNASSAMVIKSAFTTLHGLDSANVHTYISLADDNTFVASKYQSYGAFWGDGGEYMPMVDIWDLDHDIDDENAYITMNGSRDGTDNNIYAYKSNESKYYFETKLTVKQVYNGEKWGKFGITVTTENGKEGLFFYVDAVATNAENVINSDSVMLGVNQRTAGAWAGNWSAIGSLGGDSSQYQDGNYVTLGIYRQGGVFKLYANGVLLDTVSCGIMGDEATYLGLATFNMSITATDYSLKTEGLEDYEIVKSEVDHLFLGDSYIDTAFWYTYDAEFGALSQANVGVGGTKVAYWQGMAASMKEMYDAKNIVMHIGVNDIDGGATAEATIASLTQLFQTYHANYPEANIYYVSLVRNMMFPAEWSDYAAVNAAVQGLVAENEWLHYVDMDKYVVPNEDGSTMSWFIADGLHYGVDGYALFNREIAKALNIARVENEGGLGDLSVEGAPEWSYSGGWKFEEGGVAHNLGKQEGQIFIQGAYGADLYAEAKISAVGLNMDDAYPKLGLAIRSTKATYFWWLDAAGANFTNNWSQVVVRPEVVGRDWDWNGLFGQFQYTYDQSYANGSYKTLAVAKVGTTLYLIADGKVVDCAKGLLGADEEVAVSIFTFNINMYAKEGLAITDAEALKAKLDSLKIHEEDDIALDGSLADWSDADKTNPYEIPASDGRSVTVYATMGSDGLYIFYDVIANTYINNANEWWLNSNAEFRIGTKEQGEQRFVSAKATAAPYAFCSRYQPEGGVLQVNGAKVNVADEAGKKHITMEMFISYACINGYDANSESIPAGFAWKTAGEEGFLWGGGDFWYSAEADPGMRNVRITANGILTGSERVIDGDASDWTEEFQALNTKEGASGTYASRMGEDGLYMIYIIKATAIEVNRTYIQGDWWQNTNLEFWVNDGTVNAGSARITTFGGKLYHTGYVTDAEMTYVDGEAEDILTVEFFVGNHLLKSRTGNIDLGGQLYGIADTWQDYTRNVKVA